MINKKVISQLLNEFDILDIEQGLVYSYITSNKVVYSDSEIINNYLKGYSYSPDLSQRISNLDIDNIKTLESYLELLIPENDRKLNGAFFTPLYIVNYIINDISPKESDKTIDPSSGCGAFLIGLAEYYTSKYGKSVKRTIKENIYGADILSYNISRAKLLLTIFALQKGEIVEQSDFNLYQTDSLRHKWDLTFDNVIGNPPYVKFQDLSPDNRDFLTNKWESISGGTFNLYFAFFELGYKLLKQGGRLGYITPNNYFTSLAGESLRAFFTNKKCLDKIVDFNSKKVFEVQTYTAITFLTKTINEAVSYDRIDDSQSPESFLSSVNGSVNSFSELKPKKWRLLKSDEKRNIENIENIGTPIKQMFDICVGIATLKDEIFFVDGLQKNGRYFTKKGYDGKLYRIEPDITRSVFKISDFKSQNDIESNARRIIFPYKVNGSATVIAEELFMEQFPYCYEYLLSVRSELLARDKGKIQFNPFYAWGRTQGLTKFGKKILNPTFSQRPRFLLVDDEEALFTNGYGIFFKSQENHHTLFEQEENALCSIDNIDLVQKVLNSNIMHYYISKTSVAIEGGYPCYQKNFIEKFSIPNFSDNELSELRGLFDPMDINSFLAQKYQMNFPSPNLSL
ncbi:MAG: N-6 DNA methylase [Alistipes sp.]